MNLKYPSQTLAPLSLKLPDVQSWPYATKNYYVSFLLLVILIISPSCLSLLIMEVQHLQAYKKSQGSIFASLRAIVLV